MPSKIPAAPPPPPALRIPTIDSMKRFSTMTDTTFTDQPTYNFDFNFETTSDQEPLRLPDYLLEQIHTGNSNNSVNKTERLMSTRCRVQRLRPPTFQLGTLRPAECYTKYDEMVEETHKESHSSCPNNGNVQDPVSIASRRSMVPFNSSRPLSQITSNGITALPTPHSRGILSGHHDMADPAARGSISNRSGSHRSHKSRSSSMKRLRNFSIDGLAAKWHRRQAGKAGGSLSCIHNDDEGNTDTEASTKKKKGKRSNKGRSHSHPSTPHHKRPPLERIVTPRGPVSPFPSPLSSSSSVDLPLPAMDTEDSTPPPYIATKSKFNVNSIGTAIIPAYPPSSSPNSRHVAFPNTTQASPRIRGNSTPTNHRQAFLPEVDRELPPFEIPLPSSPTPAAGQGASVDVQKDGLSSLSPHNLHEMLLALQEENTQLKSQVSNLREEWYATHEELDLERWKSWKREREFEGLSLGLGRRGVGSQGVGVGEALMGDDDLETSDEGKAKEMCRTTRDETGDEHGAELHVNTEVDKDHDAVTEDVTGQDKLASATKREPREGDGMKVKLEDL